MRVLLAVLCCSAAITKAEPPSSSSSLLAMDYRWDSWGTPQGLPSSAAQAILQTRDGYVWIGTQEGLARFDGMRFTVFNKKNLPITGLFSINAILEGPDGTLWVGTQAAGLLAMKDGEFRLYNTTSGLATNTVTSLLQDRQGNFWVGTSGGLSLFRDGKFVTFTTAQGLSHDWVMALHQDRHGAVWIGTVHGLSRMENGKITTVAASELLSKAEVDALAENSDALWLGTDHGLMRFRDGDVQLYSGWSSAWGLVRSLYVDRDDTLWVGTSGNGLFRLRGGELKKCTNAGSFATVTVQWIYQDRDGSLWVGTWGDGVLRLSEQKFKTVPATTNINVVYQTPDGTVWVGTSGEGLEALKDGNLTTYTTHQGLSSNVIMALWQDGSGNLWIGTDGGGLDRLSDGKFTVYGTQQGLAGNSVNTLHEDHEGSLWIGTSDHGLQRLKDEQFTTYTVKDGLPGDAVRFIYEDRKGSLWIGTDSGLGRSTTQNYSAFEAVPGLGKDAITYIHEDKNRALWIATWGNGLKRWQEGAVTTYTTRDGLFDDSIWAILEENGRFWMTSDHGVSRIDKSELEQFAAGKIHFLHSVTYGVPDGLNADEFNGGMQPSAWKTTEGILIFPGSKGLVAMDPQRMRLNLTPPPVRIESVSFDQKPFSPYHSAALPPGKGDLEFQYTGIDFLAPQGLRFSYKLEGFDQDWIDAGNRRTAYYTNIPPGKYRFHVVARNRDGAWNSAGASFNLTLKPHYYQTLWFALLCAYLPLLAVIELHRVRVKQLKARKQELTVRVDERTKELQVEVIERRRAEEAVRRVSNQMELILNSAGEGIYGLDQEGRATFVNLAAERMLGWKAEELIGKSQHDILHHTKSDGSPYPKAECPIYSAFKDGIVRHVDKEVFWRKDGASFPVEYTSTPIREGSRLTGAVVTFRDITEPKRAEEALRASESKYRTLFDHVADPVFIVDAENYHYLDCNDTAVRVYAYTQEELLRMTPLDLCPPEIRGETDEHDGLCALQQHVLKNHETPKVASNGSAIVPFPATHQTKTGRRMEVEVLADSIEYQGRAAYITLVRDVTARKRAEALRAGENQVLEMIATNMPLEEMLAVLARFIESQCERTLCSVLLMEPGGQHLRHGAAPSLPKAYTKKIDGLRIGPNAGSCGTAAYRRQPIIVTDILEDPLWRDYRKVAARYGLRACWSVPIISHDDMVLGTFAMYYREVRTPTAAEMQLVDVAARMARIGISRKQAEQALSEAETRYRTLVEQLPAVTYIAEYGATGRWLYVSPQVETLLGFSPVDWMANPEFWFRQVHPDDRERVLAEEESTRARNKPFRAEYRMFACDGRLVWVRDEAVLLRNEPDTPALMQGVLYDITERKRSEEALGQSEERFSKAFRVSPAAISISTVRDGRYLDVNEACTKILGYSREELIGKCSAELVWVNPADRLAFVERLQNEKMVREVEARLRTKSGAIRDTLLSGELVQLAGETCALVMTQDVTERKQAEQTLRERTVELERSNADLEQFAYVASHDLREPLRMVSSFTQLLAERYKGRLDAEADEFIGFAMEGATRMSALIDGLLSFSRVQTRAKELEPTDCNSAFRFALENLRIVLQESEAQVVADSLPTVLADTSQMEQLFQNLVGNAVKFRGTTPPHVHVSAHRNGKDWIFSVSDNGIGIDPRHKDRIFGLFQRLHTRGTYDGMGIGLSICKKIVERHGGRIWVESEEGNGATFYFSMPLTEATAS